MRTALTKHLFLLCAICLCTSCTYIKDAVGQPSKTYINRNYDIKNFNSILFSGVGNIEFTQKAGKPSMSIYGPENYVKQFDVSISEGMLKIATAEHSHFRGTVKIKIKISAPSLTSIELKGVGDINILKPLTFQDLEVVNKGVGNIKMDNITGNHLTVNSSGVGNVTLSGKARVASLSCNGVGNIEAENLTSYNVDANCKGVGNITCYATDSIDATVKGVGSVKYKGNPSYKNMNKSGIGSIKQY